MHLIIEDLSESRSEGDQSAQPQTKSGFWKTKFTKYSNVSIQTQLN